MKIMAIGGVLDEDDTCRRTFHDTGDQAVCFRYKKPLDWHFQYRHAVDDHNNVHHSLLTLEDTWVTQRWKIWVFSFLLVITEVNVYLVLKYFVWPSEGHALCPTLVQSRWMFSWMLDNQWVTDEDNVEEDDMGGIGNVHMTVTAPPHSKGYCNR